jgi:hypothetical protein
MNISLKVKVVLAATCFGAYIAVAATGVGADEGVFLQSSAAVATLKLDATKSTLAKKCVSDLINMEHYDDNFLQNADPNLRAAFENTCALAYSGNEGRKMALFIMNPLSQAAEKAGDQTLANAAEKILELRPSEALLTAAR